MTVSGIGSIFNAIGMSQSSAANAASSIGATDPTAATDATSSAAAANATDPAGGTFANALDTLQASQDSADSLAVKAATGSLTDIHAYTIAATEAQLMTDLTVAVRDRAVEAFNEVMRMQA